MSAADVLSRILAALNRAGIAYMLSGSFQRTVNGTGVTVALASGL
jgi:hypothetical protein